MAARLGSEAMEDLAGWELAVQLLLASRTLFDELHRRLAEVGHAEVRPAHGFLFQAIGNGATASEIGAQLGITKQAARLMLDELEDSGYVARQPDPADARRRPARLTARGLEALRATEEILDDIKREVASVSGGADLHQGMRLLQVIQNLYEPAPLRPVW
jgi:DNA-binding MarR family transcriptional regulator